MTKKKNKKKVKFLKELNDWLCDGKSKSLKQDIQKAKRKAEKDYYRGKK